MKRITAILLCILLCVSMAACGYDSDLNDSSLSLVSETQTEVIGTLAPDTSEADGDATETTHGTTGSTEPDTTVGSQEKTPDTSETKPSDTTGNVLTGSEKHNTSETEPPEQPTTPSNPGTTTESTPTEETKPTEPAQPPSTELPKETTPPVKPTEPEETEPPTEATEPEETDPPTEPSAPEETDPPVETTEPQEPEDPYAYPFNIEQIRQDCIALGRSYGFKLDESLTPSNSSWAGAETASSQTQGTRLKRLLTEMVEYYSPEYREAMGLPAVNITAFNIYCESTGNGTYRFYFLFLL